MEKRKKKEYLKIHDFARERIGELWKAFVSEKEYILENYFVNYVYSSIFPFGQQNLLGPYHHFILLAEQYAMMRMLLCGCAGEEGITEELLTKTIMQLSTDILHNRQAVEINNAYIESEHDSLAHMAFLLRD